MLKRTFEEDLKRAVAYHGHLCAGQMNGTRMARRALEYFGIDDPDTFRDLVVFVECDRCLADAVATVTGCTMGRRRLKWMNYGKMAATFFNMQTGEAIRLISTTERCTKDDDMFEWFGSRTDEQLFTLQHVEVAVDAQELPGAPHTHAFCDRCGEEVTGGREVVRNGETLCRACADGGYYRIIDAD